jgi:hypothetical protein
MSYNAIRITFPNGKVMYGEYNNTAEQLMPECFSTTEERSEKWRNHDFRKLCQNLISCQELPCEADDADRVVACERCGLCREVESYKIWEELKINAQK